MPAATAYQTIGPYWHLLEDPSWADLTRLGAVGDKMILTGTITDGAGTPAAGACVEIWQSSPPADDLFPGWGRANTDAAGTFRLTTLKPGPVPGPGNSLQAPHIAINILSRGILTHLYTRAYFAGDPLNDADPLLNAVDDPARRATLIAHAEADDVWRLDIRLQGEGETVFIEI